MNLSLLTDDRGAVFSPCRTWRYRLWRTWDHALPRPMFLMLNPSKADETLDDRTVAKCGRYVRSWGGYGGYEVCNLFGFMATQPWDMKAAEDPVGPGNDAAIVETATAAPLVVCAWGNDGAHLGRAAAVVAMLRERGIRLHALQINVATGEPAHPLYLKGTLRPEPFEPV